MSDYGDIDGSALLSSGDVWLVMKCFLLLGVINAVILRTLLMGLSKLKKIKKNSIWSKVPRVQ